MCVAAGQVCGSLDCRIVCCAVRTAFAFPLRKLASMFSALSPLSGSRLALGRPGNVRCAVPSHVARRARPHILRGRRVRVVLSLTLSRRVGARGGLGVCRAVALLCMCMYGARGVPTVRSNRSDSSYDSRLRSPEAKRGAASTMSQTAPGQTISRAADRFSKS